MTTIPDFIDDYHLPPGEHVCSFADIESRFLITETRQRKWNDFLAMMERMHRIKLIPETVLINGSFVTGRSDPGDVDFAFHIKPDVIREALHAEDDHDKSAVNMFLDRQNQLPLRNLFGAHLLVAPDTKNLEHWSKFFRRGQNGKLREPDPQLDPDWVRTPPEKGILRVEKSDIIVRLGGDV